MGTLGPCIEIFEEAPDSSRITFKIIGMISFYPFSNTISIIGRLQSGEDQIKIQIVPLGIAHFHDRSATGSA